MSESSCDKRGHIMSPTSPRCGVCGIYSSQMMLVTREVYEQALQRLASAEAERDDCRHVARELHRQMSMQWGVMTIARQNGVRWPWLEDEAKGGET